MFGLIVVGSIVRTTGSGLSCPDWPLCEGRLIPRMEPHVLIEWTHRLLALGVSVLLFATVLATLAHREVRARLFGLAVLAIVLLVVQIALGALTVLKLLSPAIVSAHLATALLLFGTLLVIGLVAGAEADPAREPLPARPPGLLAWFSVATLALFAQIVLGGVVSTTGASLACPDWPLCRGEWLPPLEGLVAIQVAHRWGAYLLTALLLLVTLRARAAADTVVAQAGSMLLSLAIGQMALGVVNVFLGIQVWLSALHLANAAGMLAMAIAVTFRLAVSPGAARAVVAEATT